MLATRGRGWQGIAIALGALACVPGCASDDGHVAAAIGAGAPTPSAGAGADMPVSGGAATGGAVAPAQAGTSVSGASGATATPATAANSGGAAGVVPPAGGSGSSTAGTPAKPPACSDSCPFEAGVSWLCKLRFMYGINYAWHSFGGDFGGISAWNQPGVSAEPAVASELARMAAGGVQVVRWWLWPDFRGDGVQFDAQDTPVGLGGTALADLARALELAEQHDMYLMLTIFSFDNFRPTRNEAMLKVRGLTPIALDDAKRGALMEQVVAPVARAVAASPHAQRMIAWDVINEPEWAVSGASLYGGDPAFDPQTDLAAITHAQMETFIRDTIGVLRANSKALVSVGATAVKWKHAWSKLDLDFYQFHIYDWVNMYWPYDRSPAMYGLDDKPIVMGEFPLGGLTGVSYGKLLESWFGNGYAGGLGWAYTDMMFSSGRDLAEVKAFADKQPCATRY